MSLESSFLRYSTSIVFVAWGLRSSGIQSSRFWPSTTTSKTRASFAVIDDLLDTRRVVAGKLVVGPLIVKTDGLQLPIRGGDSMRSTTCPGLSPIDSAPTDVRANVVTSATALNFR